MTFDERRAAFRRWRRARPFWGGLLLIISGLELLWSGYLDLGSIQVHFGYEGFLSYLLPALMALTGVFSWVTPKQRLFYGILGMLTAVYSLIGLNLGGWFLGMLLGIVGGAMVLAWSSETPAGPTPSDTPDDATETDTIVRSPGMHRVPEDDQPGGAPARWSFRFLAILIPTLAVVAGLGLVSTAPPALAAACPAVTTPPPAPAAAPTETERPTLGDLWRDFWDRLLGRNQPTPTSGVAAEPSPGPSPSPTCTDPAPTTPGGTANPTATGTDPGAPPAPGATPTGTGAPGTPPSPGASPSPVPAPVIAAAPGQPIVSSRPARMTTSVLTLEGFAFDGVVDLPTANGSIRVLQFSIDRATNQDFRLVVDGNLAITSDPLVAAGGVKLFTSRFSGRLLGIPLTFTPDFPPPITLPNMVFTDVTLELVFLDCDTLSGPTLGENANT